MTSTPAADVFEPELLRALRAAPWRSIERPFLLILTASIGLHVVLAAYVASKPAAPAEIAIDATLERFPKRLTLPPLHPIPKFETARSTPGPSHRNAPSQPVKLGRVGLLQVIGSVGPSGSLAEVLTDGPTSIADALDGASAVLIANTAPVVPRGPASGVTSTIDPIGTTGVKKVGLGTRVDHAPAAPLDGPIVIEKNTLDPRVLQQFIAARRGAVQSCYERALLHSPQLQGKVVLRLAIATTGRVSDLDVEEDTLGSEAVTSCMSTIIKRWVFPVSPKEELPVSVPFVFARAN